MSLPSNMDNNASQKRCSPGRHQGSVITDRLLGVWECSLQESWRMEMVPVEVCRDLGVSALADRVSLGISAHFWSQAGLGEGRREP